MTALMAIFNYNARNEDGSFRGPKSFEDIRTVNGIMHPTFRVASVILHLVQDDREWDRCFAEAVLFATGREL
ncbi:hypothetical protein G6F70_001099 [Rhizopus microsporus]|nr:hypothetical protein G6F71_001076 [Rhizopus microsporus]KAG1203723.1 hypothetical protein G6F70_001099 [Rhizopus microsporus]KAG1216388.1 hypothetical protein G6F69_000150 [Rhizopus microsporus]KAG1237678.1 hypothetical protein G6F67_000996 [Rhizopus microsporus]KAG1264819.1 hypothetical protein G6F68_004078 [Rhizopus microsporus]